MNYTHMSGCSCLCAPSECDAVGSRVGSIGNSVLVGGRLGFVPSLSSYFVASLVLSEYYAFSKKRRSWPDGLSAYE